GDHVLWAGYDLQDGDSFGTQSTLSYGTRTWWGREFENQCCPAYVYMGGAGTLDASLPDLVPVGLSVLGNAPTPFQRSTMIRFALDRPSRIEVDVYDLAGRKVASRDLGFRVEAE